MFLTANLVANLLPILNRAAPIELDDAYTLIHKSPQMEQCFFQDCPALRDLRTQLLPSEEIQLNAINYREYKSSFLIWHPLYSLALSTIHLLGFSWEISYTILTILGVILLGSAVAYWMSGLFGEAAAGLGLMLLSVYVFEGPGLLYVYPKTIALAVALFYWGWLKRAPRTPAWTIPLVSLVLVGMHTIGMIYASIAAAYWLATRLADNRTVNPRELAWLTISVLVITSPLLLPLLITRPELDIAMPEFTHNLSGSANLLLNLSLAFGSVQRWFYSFWPFSSDQAWVAFPLVVFWIMAGIQHYTRRSKLEILGWFSMLALILVGSSLFAVPSADGYFSQNIWPLIVMLAYGLIGRFAYDTGWVLATRASAIFKQIKVSPRWTPVKRVTNREFVVSSLVAFSLLVGFASHARFGLRHHLYTLDWRTRRGNVMLDVQQVNRLLESSAPSDVVLYETEELMHFYFTHGALSRGALYYPTVRSSPNPDQILADFHYLNYLVAWNPIRAFNVEYFPWEPVLTFEREGMLILHPGQPLALRLPSDASIHQLYLHLISDSSGLSLTISRDGVGQSTSAQIMYADAIDLWYPLPEELLQGAETISITADPGSDTGFLAGIRVNNRVDLHWPWGSGIQISLLPGEDEAPETIVGFNPSDLFPSLSENVRILDDRGSSVLGLVGD